jgi:hypothetical protein
MMEVSGYILWTTAQGTLGGRLGLVAVECGIGWEECEGLGCCRGHVPTWGTGLFRPMHCTIQHASQNTF